MEKDSPSGISNPQSLRALIVDDSENDVLLIIRELKKGGYNPFYQRVETAAAMKKALKAGSWEVVLCDYKMPKFNAPSAITLLKETNIHIPIIIVSGSIGEDAAVECMRLGAQDYVMKGNLSHLCPVVARELEESKVRNKQKQAESQREAALEALRQSEEKYRNILKNIEDGYYEVDLAGNLTFFNDSLCRLYGYSKEELMGMNYRQYTDKETAKKVFQAYNKVYNTGEPSKEFNWQAIRKDGTKTYAELSISLKKDLSGNAIGFQGIIRDITERKRAEDALRNSEKYFKEITENSSDIIIITDKNGDVKYCSRSVERFAGYTPEELIGKSALSFIHPDDINRAAHAFGEAILSLDHAIPNGFRVIHKDGSERYFEGLGKNLLDNPDVAGFIMNVRDATERKRMEEKYGTLLENIEDGYAELDLKGNFIFFNDAISKIHGYPKNELMKLNYRDYMDEENAKKVFEKYNKAFTTGELETEVEYEIITKKGLRRYLETSIVPIKNNAKRVVAFRGIVRDRTKRKQSELQMKAVFEELLKSEEKYRTIIENIQEGYFEIDLAGNFTFFNDSMCRCLGYSPKELAGMNYKKYADKENAKKLFNTYNETYKTGTASRLLEYEIIRKDGTRRQLEGFVSLQKDSSGNPLAFRGTTRDITERRKAEKTLKESEERYRALFDRSMDILYTIDFDGNFIDANAAALNRFGYTREELHSVNVASLMDKDELPFALKIIQEIKKCGVQKDLLEIRMRHKDGTPIYIETKGSAVISNGKAIAIQSIARDVTERKAVEKKLQESEKYFKEITENSSDIILITDKNGNIKYCSRSIERFSGYTPEELIGKSGFTFIHPDDLERAVNDYSKAILSQDTAIPNEFRMIHKDGSERCLEGLGKNLLDNPDVAGFIMNVHDATENKRAEKKLLQTLESLRKAFGVTMQVMVSAIEMRDPYTAGHQVRAADIARAIATEMGLSQEKIDGIRIAGTIHDIGKLSIPAEILSKPTKLTDIEFSLIKEHSHSGYEMLKNVESPWPLAEIIHQHHERMNGTGYPRHLKGDEILIEARILAVADVVEAMSSHRPYRASLGIEAALEEIEKNKGILYDDVVAYACLKLFREKNYQLT